MKALTSVTTCCAMLFLASLYPGYCQDSGSSGVIVIGSDQQSPSGVSVSESNVSDSSETFDMEKPPQVTPQFYEISGDRIGGTQVSQAVTLPSEGIIMFVDAGRSGAFTIFRIEQSGKETQVLSVTPELAVGKKLSKGTYKVYPEDLDNKYPFEKITAKVQVGLAGGQAGGGQ